MQSDRIKTKADAMAFAIEQSGGDLGKADRIYRMFVDNMELPDMETAVVDVRFKNLTEATEALKRIIEAKLADSTESGQAQTVDEKAPSTIILPGMPGLEWMTENLSGFGGTEVDGRTYYTWEEAMAAAEQLGNGWRLPTRDEFVQLDELGSTWDEDRKGRWFGGNHETDHEGSLFIPATGFRHVTTGALIHVGTEGDYWSSSPYSSSSTGAGHLGFNSTAVYPQGGSSRANGFSVRCVRNRQ